MLKYKEKKNLKPKKEKHKKNNPIFTPLYNFFILYRVWLFEVGDKLVDFARRAVRRICAARHLDLKQFI